jgi:hypothetical protein
VESLDAFSRIGGGRWRMQLDPKQREPQGCLPKAGGSLAMGGMEREVGGGQEEGGPSALGEAGVAARLHLPTPGPGGG